MTELFAHGNLEGLFGLDRDDGLHARPGEGHDGVVSGMRRPGSPTAGSCVDLVLGEPETVDNLEQLDPERYGVIVTRGHRRGLLLPDLEGVDTVLPAGELFGRVGRQGEDGALRDDGLHARPGKGHNRVVSGMRRPGRFLEETVDLGSVAVVRMGLSGLSEADHRFLGRGGDDDKVGSVGGHASGDLAVGGDGIGDGRLLAAPDGGHDDVVRMGLSGLSEADHRFLGRAIAEAARSLNRRCVLVASGDMSHKLKEDGPYGFAPEGPEVLSGASSISKAATA